MEPCVLQPTSSSVTIVQHFVSFKQRKARQQLPLYNRGDDVMQPSGGQWHYKKETTRQRVDNPKTKHHVSRDGRPMHSPMHETVYSTLEMPMHESVYFTLEMLHIRARPTTIHVFHGSNASRSILFYGRNYSTAAHETIYFT